MMPRRTGYHLLVLASMCMLGAVLHAGPSVLWTPDTPVPRADACPLLEGVEFAVVKANEPKRDGYHWLHGAAVCWHNGKLYASFGHNKGRENTAGEQARGRVSSDGGRTWGLTFTIDAGDGNLAISHGVLLSCRGTLWAFQGAFYDDFRRTHTRAYILDEAMGVWQPKGVVVDGGFWPMQEPLKMDDGNWIMAGARITKGYTDKVANLPSVAISHGDDLTVWDLIVIPNDESVPEESIWGESTITVDGPRVVNISRWGGGNPVALVSSSSDYGRTWTPTRPSNLPMVASKPYAGTLSTGQRYLVCTTTADSGNRRSPLTIAVSRPGENVFSEVFRIRDAVHGGPGESDSRAKLSYPYAVEHEGRLYVIYSNSGSRGGNRNSAELAIIPVVSLRTTTPSNAHKGFTTDDDILVGLWSFESLQGAVARDTKGPSNGRIRGNPASASGVVGNAIQLNGRTDLVTIPHTADLDFCEASFSISAWVNVYTLDRGQQMIMAKNVYSAGRREWGLMLDDDNRFRFYLQQNGWQTVGSKTIPTPGLWYHLAVTMDAGRVRLYVNGRPEGDAVLGSSIPRTTAPMTFGGINDGGQLRQMLFGAIDEISLYRTALTAGALRTLADKATTPHQVPEPPTPYELWTGGSMPWSAEIPVLEGVEFQVIKEYEPRVDGYRFLHGVGLAWHKGRLYASFGHNKGPENTGTEEARGRFSTDGGKTWSEVFTIESGRDNRAVSHGVFLSHEGTLWAFQGAFYNIMERIHTRAYTLDEATGQWQAKGVVVDGGFWPMQEPLKMDDGNWIMAGFAGGLPGVAVSHGDDLTQWDLVVIPKDPSVGTIWGESTVIVQGNRIINVSRYGEQAVALVAVSEDYGRTWTPSKPSNLPMATSKPYTGTLSTGQHYLICTTTADSGGRRYPLTIALTRPGETEFSQIFRIRDAEHEGPGESHPRAALAYPYAVEHEGHLYVGYSNSGGGAGREGSGRELWNNNSAELAVIPIASLAVPAGTPERDAREVRLWGGAEPFPPANRIAPLTDVSYHIVHPLTEGWEFLHGAAITEFEGVLFVSFAHNPGKENTKTETLRCRRSVDGGRTWTEPEFIGPGFRGEERHSHGVFLKHQGRLWAFAARFGEGEPGRFRGLKTEAFVLNETTDQWESQGIVAQNCWPMDHPTPMDNGNWIMGGLDRNWRSVVAISRGRNLSQWDTIAIPYPEGTGFLETSIIVDGPNVTAFIRNAPTVAVATSGDFGSTWSAVAQSNYPMSAAQPFASTLSTGQRYLISNIGNRDTLVIAVSRPGQSEFVRAWSIRNGRKPEVYYQGRTAGGAWAYPCAHEHDGKLYVVYSVQKLECELAIIPIGALATD